MNSESRKVNELESLQTAYAKLKAELAKEIKKVQAIRDSFSFRLGNMLIQAVCQPGRNTILLPYRLILLGVTGFKKRRAVIAKCPAESKLSQVKFTVIYLDDLPLSPSTCMIMKKCVACFGITMRGQSLICVGNYPLDDWKRFEYLSSLLPEGKHLLDVGCQHGHFLNLAGASHKFNNIIGVDVKRYKRFLILPGTCSLQFVEASVAKLPFREGGVDVVTCMEVLEHLDKEVFVTALSELRRVVNRLLIITVPYNQPEPLPSFHKLRFTDSDLLTYFPHGEFVLLKRQKGPSWMAVVERV